MKAALPDCTYIFSIAKVCVMGRSSRFYNKLLIVCMIISLKRYVSKKIHDSHYSDHILLEVASKIVSEKINFNDTSK